MLECPVQREAINLDRQLLGFGVVIDVSAPRYILHEARDPWSKAGGCFVTCRPNVTEVVKPVESRHDRICASSALLGFQCLSNRFVNLEISKPLCVGEGGRLSGRN